MAKDLGQSAKGLVGSVVQVDQAGEGPSQSVIPEIDPTQLPYWNQNGLIKPRRRLVVPMGPFCLRKEHMRILDVVEVPVLGLIHLPPPPADLNYQTL